MFIILAVFYIYLVTHDAAGRAVHPSHERGGQLTLAIYTEIQCM